MVRQAIQCIRSHVVNFGGIVLLLTGVINRSNHRRFFPQLHCQEKYGLGRPPIRLGILFCLTLSRDQDIIEGCFNRSTQSPQTPSQHTQGMICNNATKPPDILIDGIHDILLVYQEPVPVISEGSDIASQGSRDSCLYAHKD